MRVSAAVFFYKFTHMLTLCTYDPSFTNRHSAPQPLPHVSAYCRYGRNYLDQCDSVCICDKFGSYRCQPHHTPGSGACYGGAVSGQPVRCSLAEEGGDGGLREEAHTRFFCENRTVHVEYGTSSQSYTVL